MRAHGVYRATSPASGARAAGPMVGLPAAARRALPPRAVRWPAAARGHRPGAGHRPRARRVRRGRVRARQERPGAGAQPARRPAAASSAWPTCSSPTTSSVVEHIADRVAVMYLGRVVEEGPAAELWRRTPPPLHRGAAVGRARAGAQRGSCSTGDPPSPVNLPTGCRFRTRCPEAIDGLRELRSAAGPTPATARRANRSPASTSSRSPCRGLIARRRRRRRPRIRPSPPFTHPITPITTPGAVDETSCSSDRRRRRRRSSLRWRRAAADDDADAAVPAAAGPAARGRRPPRPRRRPRKPLGRGHAHRGHDGDQHPGPRHRAGFQSRGRRGQALRR